MAKLIIKNIQELLGIVEDGSVMKSGREMAEVGRIAGAWLLAEEGLITGYGKMDTLPAIPEGAEEVDASGRLVMPAFCDSHTHMVFAGTREIEYVDKIRGLSYEEIARRGGGILNSARKMAEVSEEELLIKSLERLDLIRSYGTGAVEIKSGYGLTTETELKMLRVIKKLRKMSPVTIRATFLGAHAFPMEYRENHKGYVDLIVKEMLPAVAEEQLADMWMSFATRAFSVSRRPKGYWKRQNNTA